MPASFKPAPKFIGWRFFSYFVCVKDGVFTHLHDSICCTVNSASIRQIRDSCLIQNWNNFVFKRGTRSKRVNVLFTLLFQGRRRITTCDMLIRRSFSFCRREEEENSLLVPFHALFLSFRTDWKIFQRKTINVGTLIRSIWVRLLDRAQCQNVFDVWAISIDFVCVKIDNTFSRCNIVQAEHRSSLAEDSLHISFVWKMVFSHICMIAYAALSIVLAFVKFVTVAWFKLETISFSREGLEVNV